MPKSRLLASSLLSPLSKSLHVIDMGFPNNFKYNAIQAHRWGNSKLFLINHLLSLDSFFLGWDLVSACPESFAALFRVFGRQSQSRQSQSHSAYVRMARR